MGHARVYTISDALARYRRMQGYDTFHPTGWDAFGLPAENAAIERGLDPAKWTEENIDKMKAQLIGMNTAFDWDHELKTCSPEFYRHTQRIFLMLFRRGLAYQAQSVVNYDPVDKTVLANEQVDAHGRSWRSGALVEHVSLKQWFFRIKEFQEDLLAGLDLLENSQRWPERVITLQRNWLGRSEGAKITFELTSAGGRQEVVRVFTTRPDTLFGVTYIALSMSHPLVTQLSAEMPDLERFLSQKSSFSHDSKEGYLLPGLTANSPLVRLDAKGRQPLPVYVAPYVLDEYGEGAVMGVPGHDNRDLAFWKQHCPEARVPIVITGADPLPTLEPLARDLNEAQTEKGVLSAICGSYSGLDSSVASSKIVADLEAHGAAESAASWRLRDWLVSRQRYWGTPIPIVHCGNCGPVAVPEIDLPVRLPEIPSDLRRVPGNPLEKIEEWVNTSCPSCGRDARRETDTMDTFVDSSWYFLRFPDAANTSSPFSLESTKRYMPVDTYIGGVEHAILHLLYARFIYKFLCSEGMIAHTGGQEPFTQLISQGMVHGKTFSDPDTGRFLRPEELANLDAKPVIAATGKQPSLTWEKMSKSKHNGVDPFTIIAKYGADATRAHILFAAPISEVLQWDEEKIVGIQRWFQRLSRLVYQTSSLEAETISADTSQGTAEARDQIMSLTASNAEAFLLTQNTIKSVTDTFEQNLYGLNTIVSDLIKLTNGLIALDPNKMVPWLAYDCLSALLRMLAPAAPAYAEQLWEDLHAQSNLATRSSIFEHPWPRSMLDKELKAHFQSQLKILTCAVQINGKLRFTAKVPSVEGSTTGTGDRGSSEAVILESILATKEGNYWLKEKNEWERRKRVILVDGGKLVNIVF